MTAPDRDRASLPAELADACLTTAGAVTVLSIAGATAAVAWPAVMMRAVLPGSPSVPWLPAVPWVRETGSGTLTALRDRATRT